jgi:hypothetical protein
MTAQREALIGQDGAIAAALGALAAGGFDKLDAPATAAATSRGATRPAEKAILPT